MHWIDPKEIAAWSDLHEAQAELPALVRRLAINTAARITGANIPSGSSVNIGGWDGTFESEGGVFVPEGKVMFEMSCGAGAASKAKENYDKRTADPFGVIPLETTFIFITPRIWTGRDEWEKERIAEGKWKSVKAYDATILSQWIDTSPVVASYFARRVGKLPPSGFIALSDFWEEWAKATNPVSLPLLLTGGRKQQTESLEEWAKGAPSTFFVQGENKDEAIAFVAAWASTEGKDILDRALVIKDHETWLNLSRGKTPLVLMPDFKEEYSATVATTNGHHVLVPLEGGERLAGNGCVLPRQTREAFLLALKDMGLSEREAEVLSNSTGRHLPTVRRRLIDHAGGPKPSWASAVDAKALLPALLLGQWTESEGDLNALAALANLPASEVLATYQMYLNQPDSPLRKVGNHWRLTSHEEAWELLSPYLSKAETDRFMPFATSMLTELSPSFELPSDERYMAAIRSKVLSHSEVLRDGVSATLALMACRSETLSPEVASLPSRIIYTVLKASASDWRFWATTSALLSTLIEAVPEELLEGMESALNIEACPLFQLFKEEGDGFWGASHHTGLLWALERVAMGTDYFARASLILAHLVEIDPGGHTANRPLESLNGLFLGWIHYSDATDAERLKVLDIIIEKVPETGWKLLIEIIPSSHSSIVGRQPPIFRAWGQRLGQSPTQGELATYDAAVAQRILTNVGSNPERWATLVEHIPSLSQEDRAKTFSQLEEALTTSEDIALWSKTREKIRGILNHHRSYPEMNWAMPIEDVDRLAAIYETLTPNDRVLANAWLFNYWPELPEGGRRTDDETKEVVENLQRNSLEAIYGELGVSGINRLIDAAVHAGSAGYLCGKYLSDKLDVRDIILAHLGSEHFPQQAFSLEATRAMYARGGWKELQSLIDEAQAAGISHASVGQIYLAAEVSNETWERLGKEPEEVQKHYWSNLNTHALTNLSASDYQYGAGKLLDYNRAPDLIDQISYGREDAPSSLIIRALELAPKNLAAAAEAKLPIRVSSHDIARVFGKLDAIQDVERAIVARLELPFASILHLDRPHLALHDEVAKDPTTFADFISWVYKRADGEVDDDGMPEEQRERRARIGWSILHDASVLPGHLPDGTIDSAIQITWVKECIRLCAERGREKIGRHIIGQILGCAPEGVDGIWPCEAVRKTLDAFSDREIGSGFTTRKQNLRGVTTRGTYDGGEQERKLAEKYRKDGTLLRVEYPFTSSLLRGLAGTYDYEATSHDDDSAWIDR